jgi:quinoprotein glucose dehydrogenase
MRPIVCIVLAGLSLFAATDWPAAGGNTAFTHYSPLKQINRGNVSRLQIAWKFDTGDAFKGSELQCNPLVIGGVLYATTPKLRVIALDAATGELIWSFDPHEGRGVRNKVRNRGLMYWSGGGVRRLYFGAGHDLVALDAATGKPAAEFGTEGRVDLREGLGRDPKSLNVGLTSPGVVYKDLLIIGSIVPEGLPSSPGDIRAYDARSGKLRWSFHTVPHPGEFGYETWPKDAWKTTGGANSWPGLALDTKRGLVFAPTGSAAFDFYGSDRPGDNLFANSLLALRADTGERVWHFQFVRHDVWDRDLPTAPVLVSVRRNGRMIDAVAQATKSGFVFVFERETGKPLFPIEYRNVAASTVDGEVLARQQPLPTKPEPFARQIFTEDMVTRRTPEARRLVLERFRKVRNGPQFTPPSLEGTIVFPGFDGGAEWGGPAFDPETGLFYVNSNEMPWILRLVPKQQGRGETSGRVLYNRNCAGCHREDLGGSPPEFPSLRDIGKHRTRDQIDGVIRKGAGRMPGFAHLRDPGIDAILSYLITGDDTAVAAGAPSASPFDLKYGIDGYNKFLDPEGYPAVTPPWGTLNAINLHTGDYAWKIPFGEFPELAAKGLKNTGSENYGGGVVTAGGLLFIGATNHDRKFRVFDKSSGKLLWETTLDAAANATPAVYEVNGRQFVVVAAGGGKSGAPSGGTYYAFALPAP